MKKVVKILLFLLGLAMGFYAEVRNGQTPKGQHFRLISFEDVVEFVENANASITSIAGKNNELFIFIIGECL